MKKILFYVVVYLGIMLPNSVSAASSDISLKCNDEIIPGGNFNCTISTLLTDSKIKGIQFNYEFDNDFSYVETVANNNWQLLSHNNKGLMAVNIKGTNTNETIANTKFLVSNDIIVNNNYKFKIKNIILTDGEKDISINEKVHTVKVLSIKDIIQNIKVGNEEINLKDGVTDYTFTLENTDKVSLEINLKDKKYTFADNFESGVITIKDKETTKNVTIKKDNIDIINLSFKFKKNIKEENTEQNIDENPKTGVPLITITLILLASILFIIYYRKKTNMEAK